MAENTPTQMVPSAQKEKVWLFVGLGNPGKKYEMTRHNIGYMVIKALARKLDWRLKEETRFQAYVGKGKLQGVEVHLLMPTTYMNLSGGAVRRYLDYYRLSVESVLVVSDDLALPFGEMRMRMMGSSGGHNGLESVEACLGTRHYTRLRMGIGAAPKVAERSGDPVVDYVLGGFAPHEQQELDKFIERAVLVLEKLTLEKITKVMSDVNAKPNPKTLKTGLGDKDEKRDQKSL